MARGVDVAALRAESDRALRCDIAAAILARRWRCYVVLKKLKEFETIVTKVR